MSYKRILSMDVYEIIRRWLAKQTISHIASALGYDRKTVRGYINYAKKHGLSLDKPLSSKEELTDMLKGAVKPRKHKRRVG